MDSIRKMPFSRHRLPTAVIAVLIFICFGMALAQPTDTGLTASALGSANLRAAASIDAAVVGEIQAGTRYSVLGRSELYP